MALRKSATMSAKSKIRVIDATEPWSSFSMLLYGSPGCGKTYLAGTAVQVPEMKEVLLLDNDGGSRTVRDKSHFEGIKVVSMVGCGTKEYHDVFRWFVGDKRVDPEVAEIMNSLKVRPDEFKTIIIDNLGALQWATIQDILQTTDRNRADPETPSLQDYGLARARMKNLQTLLAQYAEDTKKTFIFTCHVEIMKNEYEAIAKMRPALSGKLAYEIPGDMPIVGFIDVASGRKKIGQQGAAPDAGIRTIYFDPRGNPKLEVKDQSEKLGFAVENPSMVKIHKLLFK